MFCNLRCWLLIPCSALVLSALPADGRANSVLRINHVPGGGLVGDVWTFRCPVGGRAAITVDALADVPEEEDGSASNLDPTLKIYDGLGDVVAAGDDELACSARSSCEAKCPSVDFECGSGVVHSIVVADAGLRPGCAGGGTYLLSVEVLDAGGGPRIPGQVQLGGGPPQAVPPFLLAGGLVGRRGPVIDDGSLGLLP
jgi:hypothetical protein